VSTATDIIAVTFSGGSLLIAGWAAWGTHQARAWQRRRDEERLATRVRVEVTHVVESLAVTFGPEPEHVGFEVGVPPETRDVVEVDAINDGEATEYVSAAFMVAAEDSDRSAAAHRAGQGRVRVRMLPVYGDPADLQEPRELPPRTRLTFTAYPRADELEWLRAGAIAIVWLASGREARSEVQRRDDELGRATQRIDS
jgi:hypothetical protein